MPTNRINYRRQYLLKTEHGMTDHEYASMLLVQNGKCAICGEPLNKTRYNGKCYIDHDHLTGKTRGILCGYCNVGLGKFKDNIDTLRKAHKYLISYGR